MLAFMSRNKNEISNVSEFLKRVKEIRDEWWSKDKDDPWMPWFRGHRLTVSWYINEPKLGDKPNVYCKNYDFYASREIKDGDELTVDYSKYSDPMPVWLMK